MTQQRRGMPGCLPGIRFPGSTIVAKGARQTVRCVTKAAKALATGARRARNILWTRPRTATGSAGWDHSGIDTELQDAASDNNAGASQVCPPGTHLTLQPLQ